MSKWVLILFILVIFVLSYALLNKPHKFSDGECQACHMNYKKDPKFLTSPISIICKNCHDQITLQSSHPVDISPVSSVVPPDLPLTHGMITCNTCHDIHGDHVNVFGEKTYFLRRLPPGRNFCMACHRQGISFDSHMDAIDVAHIGSRFKVIDPSEPIDQVSRDCISCHGGIVGSAATFKLGAGIWSHNYADHSHPIGINYEMSRMERKDAWLKPLSTLDKRFRFFDGKIGCGTCHDVYSKSKNSLVMGNQNSNLCRSCHEL